MRLVSQCTTQNLKLSVKWFSVSVTHGTINTSANRQMAVMRNIAQLVEQRYF